MTENFSALFSKIFNKKSIAGSILSIVKLPSLAIFVTLLKFFKKILSNRQYLLI